MNLACRFGCAWGASRLHLHHRLHPAGLSPASASDLACPLPAHLPFSWRSPTAVLPPLPSPVSFSPHPIIYLPFSISPHPSFHPTPCPPLGDPSSTSTHSLQRRRPSSAQQWYPPTSSDIIDQLPPPWWDGRSRRPCGVEKTAWSPPRGVAGCNK